MNRWMVFTVFATLVVGVVGVGLAATGRPLVGISMAVYSVATAHLTWLHHD